MASAGAWSISLRISVEDPENGARVLVFTFESKGEVSGPNGEMEGSSVAAGTEGTGNTTCR